VKPGWIIRHFLQESVSQDYIKINRTDRDKYPHYDLTLFLTLGKF
jgi:hypothetical protein